jgi:hypothetical protein
MEQHTWVCFLSPLYRRTNQCHDISKNFCHFLKDMMLIENLNTWKKSTGIRRPDLIGIWRLLWILKTHKQGTKGLLLTSFTNSIKGQYPGHTKQWRAMHSH